MNYFTTISGGLARAFVQVAPAPAALARPWAVTAVAASPMGEPTAKGLDAPSGRIKEYTV